MKNKLFGLALVALVIVSCKKEEETTSNETTTDLSKKGVFILNEGKFGASNGTVTHYDPSTGVVTDGLYKNANNGVGLGETVQNLAFNGEKAYIVIKGSGKVVVANSADYKHFAEIKTSYPIQVKFDNGTGYLTNGQATGVVYKFNPSTNAITDSVSVEKTPSDLIINNGKVLVINGTYWDSGNSVNLVDSGISVINQSTFKVEKKVQVGYKPKFFVKDANGAIWVGIAGRGKWDTGGGTKPQLVKLDANGDVAATYDAGAAEDGMSALSVSKDGKKLVYLTSKGIYSLSITGGAPAQLVAGSFYGMAVNPSNGNIYAFDAKDFSSLGAATIYDESGSKLKEITTGVVPNGAVFKN